MWNHLKRHHLGLLEVDRETAVVGVFRWTTPSANTGMSCFVVATNFRAVLEYSAVGQKWQTSLPQMLAGGGLYMPRGG